MTHCVLLTGASGYIGLHCCKALLDAGHTVRASLRDQAKASEVMDTLQQAGVDTTALSFVQLDLLSDEHWLEAATGCDALMHVASPFVVANPKDPEQLIRPAVDGSLRALNAAKQANVQRVVMTSSVLSMMGSMRSGTVTASDWTDLNTPNLSAYTQSKTLAERAAWDFMATDVEPGQLELVVIAPGGVVGPPLGQDISGQSLSMLQKMLRGKMPLLPNAAFPMVDVRDVAEIQTKAITQRGIEGQRIIVAEALAWSFARVAKVLNEAGYRGPSARIAPDFVIRLAALFDAEAEGMLGFLGFDIDCDNQPARQAFNWQPRCLSQSVIESAKAVSRV